MKMTNFYRNTLDYLSLSLKSNENYDVVSKKIKVQGKTGTLFLLTTLSSGSEAIAIGESLITASYHGEIDEKIYNAAIGTSKDEKDLLRLILSGVAVLLIPNRNDAITIEIRAYPSRSVSEPSSEKSLRGSKDGFTETLNTNIALIRRRIKAKDFKIDLNQIGEKSQTDVALVYLEDKVDKRVLDEVKNRISEIKAASLIMSDRALEEKILPQKYCPYPLVRYTERPDVAAINIMRGKIVVIVDTSPDAIILPTTLFEHTKHVEEYRESPLVGNFTRLLRTIGIVLSVILVPLWYVLVTETSVNNFFVLRPSGDAKIPIYLQIIFAEIFVELIRLAIVHTPNELTSSIGMVAAIILGSVTIEIKFFLPEVLVYVSFSAIAFYATPSYELSQSNRITKYFFLISSFILGRSGFLLAILITFCYLSSLKTLGVPYLYPLLPFNPKKLKEYLFRSDSKDREIV